MKQVASELREIRKHIVRLDRKHALARLPGVVCDRDEKKWMVRLDLGPDPDTGETVKGPWVSPASGAAGTAKTSFALPSIGEQMYLHSASGVIGADSVAVHGSFTDANPKPQQDAEETVLFERGKSRISMKDGQFAFKVSDDVSHLMTTDGHIMKVGDRSYAMTTDHVFKGGLVKHDDAAIGSTHTHKDVQPGGGISGPPNPA